MKFIAILLAALLCLCVVQAQKDCPSICPALSKPTCGYNGKCYKTFANECELGVANCNGQGNFRKVHQTQCSHGEGIKC